MSRNKVEKLLKDAIPEEMSRKFGFKLTRREQTPNAFAMSAEKKEKPDVAGAVNEWLGPLADELDAITDENVSENEFAERLAACAEGKKFGSSEKFERFLEGQIYEGFANGVTK